MILSHFLVDQWTCRKRFESSNHDFILSQRSKNFLHSLPSDRDIILIRQSSSIYMTSLWVFSNQMNVHYYSAIICMDLLNCRTIFLLHSNVYSLLRFLSVHSSMQCLYPITRLSLLIFSFYLSKGICYHRNMYRVFSL
jgi:hypothetical protein